MKKVIPNFIKDPFHDDLFLCQAWNSDLSEFAHMVRAEPWLNIKKIFSTLDVSEWVYGTVQKFKFRLYMRP
jgi:hypothetical protein